MKRGKEGPIGKTSVFPIPESLNKLAVFSSEALEVDRDLNPFLFPFVFGLLSVNQVNIVVRIHPVQGRVGTTPVKVSVRTTIDIV